MSGPIGSLNTLQQLADGTGNPVRTNELIDSFAPLAVWSQRHNATTGLTLALNGGRSPFTGDPVAEQDVDVSAFPSTTVYVAVAKADDTISADDGTTDWNDHANFAQLMTLTTSASAITAVDPSYSFGVNGIFGPAAGATTASQIAVVDSGNYFSTDVSDVEGALQELGAALGSVTDPELAAIAGLTSAANKGIQFTGAGTAATYDLTTAGKALLDDADAAAQRTTLGLAIGTNVQAFSARLADFAGITYAQGDVFYFDGSNIVKLAAGTSGHFLKTNGAGANPAWAAVTGTGTVTHTGGALTANALVLGAGSDDTKVVPGIVSDGTSALTLGEAGTSVGKTIYQNATSGSITVQPPTGALGTVTMTWQAVTGTVYSSGGTDVPVADGGTGASSLTAYAVLCGGTTSTAAVQPIASVGTSGHVLTSNGAGALPTFQAPAGGSGTKTYAVLTPLNSFPPLTNFATLDTLANGLPVLDFDGGSTNESARWLLVIPEGASLGSGLKFTIKFTTTSATTGNVRWGVQLMRLNADISVDSFDTSVENHVAVSGDIDDPASITLTLTTIDSVAAQEACIVEVYRDASDTTNDTASGDAELHTCEVWSAA